MIAIQEKESDFACYLAEKHRKYLATLRQQEPKIWQQRETARLEVIQQSLSNCIVGLDMHDIFRTITNINLPLKALSLTSEEINEIFYALSQR